MIRNQILVLVCAAVAWPAAAQADVVTDWNSTIRNVIQSDGTQLVNKANPGWSTRAIAMMNGAIYDVFQAKVRTHAPFLVNTSALPDASLEAAVNQAAYEVLANTYPGESGVWQSDYNTRMGLIPNDVNKTNGMMLGSQVAQAYIANRSSDHSGDMVPYTPGIDPGEWRPDPYHPGQNAWGPEWKSVHPFAIPNTSSFVGALTPPPSMTSVAYADALNQVENYGALDVYGPADTPTSRNAEQTEIGLFWGYDRATMGPPPVLFVRNLEDVSAAVGNSAADNARMFAMASVAMADAAIAAWDAKFQYNYWRPVAAILEADTDGNPGTTKDPDWRPLGAPGGSPGDSSDDFTPPFPAWTSGHATMGGAVFKALEDFYGTNDFGTADFNIGDDLVTGTYTLTSQEFDANGAPGMSRDFNTFTLTQPLDVGVEVLDDSPEGENGISRIYLGIHWLFDQQDGIALGNNIANYVAANRFQAVPEPSAFALAFAAVFGNAMVARRRKIVR